MLAPLLLSIAWVSVIKGVMLFLFSVCALLLILIVLLQEPKGGGLAAAFGGAGAETFGVQTGSVNRFTSYVATVFMVLAILYAAIRPAEEGSVLLEDDGAGVVAPADPGDEKDDG